MVLQTEFGGLPESLANLYTITGQERYLATAQRFYHAVVLDPLADGLDILPGLQANVTTPKIIACVRMWEETGSGKYHDIAQNFWDIVTGHHVYVIGGVGNYEHFQAPDVVAAQLSNFTCENCVSYNMLKLTRLLHFHQPQRVDMLDYYERTLFNQMLGEQDPASPHGFNCYYTGLSSGAFKRQPLNYFPQGNPGMYATDWDTFTCDTATGLETQAKFADTIYSRDADGIYVNLFIPSQVRSQGLVLEQATGFPDDPVIRLSVLAGEATLTLRVRVPKWVAGPPTVRLNGAALRDLPGAGPSRLDHAAAPVADGRPARGHAADGTGRRADARPPGGAGAALRPGRAERRLRQRPGLADPATRDGLHPPDGRAAHDVRGRRRPQAGQDDPDRPGRPPVLHDLLANDVAPMDLAWLTPSPPVTAPEAAEAIRACYGLAGELARLPGEADDNFALRADGGQRYVVKVAHLRADPAVVGVQVRVLPHIESVAAGLPVPRVVPPSAASRGPWSADGPLRGRVVHVLTYLDGELLRSVQAVHSEHGVGRCRRPLAPRRPAIHSMARPSSRTCQPVKVISLMIFCRAGRPPGGPAFLPHVWVVTGMILSCGALGAPSDELLLPGSPRQPERHRERAGQQPRRGERGPLRGTQVHRQVTAVAARQGEEDRADPGDAERHAERVHRLQDAGGRAHLVRPDARHHRHTARHIMSLAPGRHTRVDRNRWWERRPSQLPVELIPGNGPFITPARKKRIVGQAFPA